MQKLNTYLFKCCIWKSITADLKFSHVTIKSSEKGLKVFQTRATLPVGRQDVNKLAAKVIQKSSIWYVFCYEPWDGKQINAEVMKLYTFSD